jgi:hypothetical protein
VGTITGLIEAEEKAALARFRSSHFEERLKKRIESADTPSRPFSFPGIPRPVWISIAVLILLGGALLLHRLFRVPAPDANLTIENFLRQLPGIQAIENRTASPPGATPVTVTSLNEVLAVFMANPRTPMNSSPNPRRHQGFSSINPKAEPMDLRDIYDILIINKSVERVLTAVSQKTKEG